MNPQQRIAAIGTDKELSDLLDFSAVRHINYYSIPTFLIRSVSHF